MTGKLSIDRELHKGEEVVVHLVDDEGEQIASAHATVVSVAFTDKDRDGLTETTREHKLKLDA